MKEIAYDDVLFKQRLLRTYVVGQVLRKFVVVLTFVGGMDSRQELSFFNT